MRKFEQVPHTADIQIRAYGTTLAELFCNALVGMFQIMRPVMSHCTFSDNEVSCTSLPIERLLDIKAANRELLLVSFLSEALALSDIHNEAYLEVSFDNITDTSVQAHLRGAPIERLQEIEIKAVTYHNLAVQQNEQGFSADIVFDI